MGNISKQATLLFLIDGDKILLAMKKRGFGVGRWNGVGGKPEPGESIEQTAQRECHEEIGVIPNTLKKVAVLDFYFPVDKQEWNQRVVVYFCTDWQNKPMETEEMKPQWFRVTDIPYDEMWQDDRYWLPQVLDGQFVEAEFTFDSADNVLSQNVTTSQL